MEASAPRCALAAAFWPGPLTMVLPRRITCPVALLAGAGLDTLAVRVPAHPVALDLLRAVGKPVAAPSANRSGAVSPTTADHVLDGLGRPHRRGGRWRSLRRRRGIHRAGPVAARAPSCCARAACRARRSRRWSARSGTASRPAEAEQSRTLRSPGLLVSHYAPGLPVRLDAADVAPEEALLAFGPPLPGAAHRVRAEPGGDAAEAASRLFTGLRWLDAEGGRLGLRGIAAMAVPPDGLGAAINDRLQRAAAPR